MSQFPRSAYDEVNGMKYFARMTDKIRLHNEGKLPEDFHDFLGKGLDARCCDFLRINYEDLKKAVFEHSNDEELLTWSMQAGRELNENDVLIWNAFLVKLGWNDHVTENVTNRKKESGLEDRDDIVTMLEYMEIDEGRKK